MSKERRFSREVAMQVIFQWEIQGVLAPKNEECPAFIGHTSLEGILGHFLKDFYSKDKKKLDMPFIIELIEGTLGSINKIDSLLDEASTRWKLSRMSAIDRAILRIGCFEMVIQGLPAKIVINEAIEIAKRYGGEQSHAFVNGVLDALQR